MKKLNSVDSTIWKYFIDMIPDFVMVSNPGVLGIEFYNSNFHYHTFAILDKHYEPRYYAIVPDADNEIIPYSAIILNHDYSLCLDGSSNQSARFAAEIRNLFDVN